MTKPAGQCKINAMTTINDIADLLRIIKEQPEWAEAVRGALLSEEVLSLPERFNEFVQLTRENNRIANERLTELKAGVSSLETALAATNQRLDEFIEATDRNFQMVYGRLDRIDGRLDSIDGRQDHTDGRLDSIDGRLDRMDSRFDGIDSRFDGIDSRFDRIDGRLDNGLGMNYEFKIEKNISSIAGQHLGIRLIHILRGYQANQDFFNSIYAAENNGIITEEQVHELERADLIFTGHRRSDQTEPYVVAELSVTIGDDDITRAQQRAAILSSAIGQTVLPVVIGVQIDQERADLADANGVTVVISPEN